MGHEFISDVLQPLAVFGGIAMVIWASAKAKLEHRKLDMMRGQPQEARPAENRPPLAEDRVLAELKSTQQQIAEMQSTGHQFDISFDAALERLESRVNRLETKSAAATSTAATEPGQTLRNGQGL